MQYAYKNFYKVFGMKPKIFRLFTTITIVLFISCSHFSGNVHLNEKEMSLYGSIHQSLKSFDGIDQAADTHVLLYRNWQYSGFWNDLESWKMSQEIFELVCIDYWKIPAGNIKVIEHDRAGGLEFYLKNFKGKRLIIYFVSHQNSKSQIILNNGAEYPTSRFAGLLNNLKAKTFLVFDTCHAEILKAKLRNRNVSVYYASPVSKVAYDFRPKGQKPTLNEMSENTHKFIKAAWGLDVKSVSPFGFFLVKALLEDSYEGCTLNSLMTSIIAYNRKLTTITGLGRYPQVSYDDSAGWGSLKMR